MTKIVDMGYAGIRKIISGGQIGVDQGALEGAKNSLIETGGWIPYGWRTAYGEQPELSEYNLKQHSSENYAPRTRQNIEDADGTLIIASSFSSPGTLLTLEHCRKINARFFTIQVNLSNNQRALEAYISKECLFARNWIINNEIEILNVAGNRGVNQEFTEKLHSISKRIVEKIVQEVKSVLP